MSLKADQVRAAFALLKGRYVAPEEAARKAHLLTSREELIASVVTVEDALRAFPSARARLRSVAMENYARPATPRPERMDGILPREAKLVVAEALGLAIKEGNSVSARKAHDAIAGLSRVSEEYSSVYHWRIQPEP